MFFFNFISTLDGENLGSVQCSRPKGILACSPPAGQIIDNRIPFSLMDYSDDHSRKNTNGKSTKKDIGQNNLIGMAKQVLACFLKKLSVFLHYYTISVCQINIYIYI